MNAQLNSSALDSWFLPIEYRTARISAPNGCLQISGWGSGEEVSYQTIVITGPLLGEFFFFFSISSLRSKSLLCSSSSFQSLRGNYCACARGVLELLDGSVLVDNQQTVWQLATSNNLVVQCPSSSSPAAAVVPPDNDLIKTHQNKHQTTAAGNNNGSACSIQEKEWRSGFKNYF